MTVTDQSAAAQYRLELRGSMVHYNAVLFNQTGDSVAAFDGSSKNLTVQACQYFGAGTGNKERKH